MFIRVGTCTDMNSVQKCAYISVMRLSALGIPGALSLTNANGAAGNYDRDADLKDDGGALGCWRRRGEVRRREGARLRGGVLVVGLRGRRQGARLRVRLGGVASGATRTRLRASTRAGGRAGGGVRGRVRRRHGGSRGGGLR